MKCVLALMVVFMFSCATVKNKKEEKVVDSKETQEKVEVKQEDKESKVTEETKESFEKITCKVENDIRTIAIIPSNPTGCKVSYTKNGESKTIAEAVHETSVCDEVSEKVKNNLEKAGFTCK